MDLENGSERKEAVRILASSPEYSQFAHTCTSDGAVTIRMMQHNSFRILVPGGGVEPPRAEARRILSQRGQFG